MLNKAVNEDGEATIAKEGTAPKSHPQAEQQAGKKNILFREDLVNKYGGSSGTINLVDHG